MGASTSKKIAARIITKLPKGIKGAAKKLVKVGPGRSAQGKKNVSDRIDRVLWGNRGRRKR